MAHINKRIQFSRLRKNGRRPVNYPTEGCGVPLRITQMFPLKLKDITPEKLRQQSSESDLACINEMMSLFDCFEKSDYSASACQQQAAALEKCHSTHMDRKLSLKKERLLQMKEDKK